METARPVAGAGGAGDENGQEQVQSNTRPPAAQHLETFHEADRQRALAELRVHSLELRLALAHVDHLGLLLRDNLIAPWGARAAVADLYAGGPDAENQ